MSDIKLCDFCQQAIDLEHPFFGVTIEKYNLTTESREKIISDCCQKCAPAHRPKPKVGRPKRKVVAQKVGSGD